MMLEIARFIAEHFGTKPTLGVFRGEKDKSLDFEQVEVPRLFPKKLVAYNTIAASILLGDKLNNFDLVITHSGGFWKRKSNFFVYREPGDLDAMLKVLPFESKIAYFVPYWVALYSLRRADLALAASRRAEQFFKRHEIRYFLRTSNFIDLRVLPQLREREYAGGDFNIVFIGRDDKLKRLGLLREVVRKLQDPSLKLHIFGVGGKSSVSEVYHGWQKEEKVLDFLANEAHLFVLPSIFEASPLSLLKALALGVPSLCSNNSLPLEYKELVPVFRDKNQLVSEIKAIKRNYNALGRKFFGFVQVVRTRYEKLHVLGRELGYIFDKVKI